MQCGKKKILYRPNAVNLWLELEKPINCQLAVIRHSMTLWRSNYASPILFDCSINVSLPNNCWIPCRSLQNWGKTFRLCSNFLTTRYLVQFIEHSPFCWGVRIYIIKIQSHENFPEISEKNIDAHSLGEYRPQCTVLELIVICKNECKYIYLYFFKVCFFLFRTQSIHKYS